MAMIVSISHKFHDFSFNLSKCCCSWRWNWLSKNPALDWTRWCNNEIWASWEHSWVVVWLSCEVFCFQISVGHGKSLLLAFGHQIRNWHLISGTFFQCCENFCGVGLSFFHAASCVPNVWWKEFNNLSIDSLLRIFAIVIVWNLTKKWASFTVAVAVGSSKWWSWDALDLNCWWRSQKSCSRCEEIVEFHLV